jgi:hypothetical protein
MSTAATQQHETFMTTMTPEEWASVPDNPRQRDTECRAAKARHLNTLEAAHTLVHMAEWGAGRCKLEGHTRALKWMQSPETAPESIDVRVYVVDSIEEAKRLYGHFNSKEEGERSNDRLFGALRENEITPVSDFVRKAKFSNAVSMAHAFYVEHSRHKPLSVYEKVAFFREEIVLLDRIAGASKRMIGPVVCCFLMAAHKHGPAVMDFFQRYILDGGAKDGRRKDCVQLFSDVMADVRSGGFCDWATQEKSVAKGLWCIDRWLSAPTAMLTRVNECDPWSYRDK